MEILEYCSENDLIKREQFYLNTLIPDYNVLKYAYSLKDFKHSEETIKKLKNKIISPEHKELLSSIHKGKVVSEETRLKLANSIYNFKKNNLLTPEALENIRSKTIKREGVSVTVLNIETKEVKVFTNQTEAGKLIGVTRQAIYNAIKRDSLINGIYKITKKQ